MAANPQAEVEALLARADQYDRLASQAREAAAELQAKLCLKETNFVRSVLVPSTGKGGVSFALGLTGWQIKSRHKAGLRGLPSKRSSGPYRRRGMAKAA